MWTHQEIHLIEIRKKVFNDGGSMVKKDNRPVLTKWKNVPMIRNHSIRAAVRQILAATKALDVVKVGIIGEPSTGKSELANTLAHLIHKISEEEGMEKYAVKSFAREDFMDMEGTLAKLTPVNYIMKFRDLSFLSAGANKKEIEQVKKTITEIRHLKEDVKVILIYDYHYTLGLDKYLRQADFRFFTSLGSSEAENMEKIVGSKYKPRLDQFKKMYVEIKSKQKASFLIRKQWFTYSYKNPFVPCLFYDEAKLRFVVFPLRTWIDPICSICTHADSPEQESEVSVEQFLAETEKKYTRKSIINALKLKLFVNGINTYDRHMSSVSKYIDRALEKKNFNLEELANAYELTVKRTKLRKKLDGVLD